MSEPGVFPEEAADTDRRLSTAAIAGTGPARDRLPADEPRSFGDGGASAAQASATGADRPAPLYSPEEAQRLREQWGAVQASFVDEPRRAVEQADNLVAVALKHLAEAFAQQRSGLEGQWDRGDAVSTEDLRLVLQQYRSFFDRLLSI